MQQSITRLERVSSSPFFAPSHPAGWRRTGGRSEEHTSELQSLAYLVCRLLLEKKKNTSEIQSLDYIVCRLLCEKTQSKLDPQLPALCANSRTLLNGTLVTVLCCVRPTVHSCLL